MTSQAFSAWLTGHGSKGQSFDQYCRKLGLIKREKMSPEEAKLVAEYAKSKADAIMRMDQNGR